MYQFISILNQAHDNYTSNPYKFSNFKSLQPSNQNNPIDLFKKITDLLTNDSVQPNLLQLICLIFFTILLINASIKQIEIKSKSCIKSLKSKFI